MPPGKPCFGINSVVGDDGIAVSMRSRLQSSKIPALPLKVKIFGRYFSRLDSDNRL